MNKDKQESVRSEARFDLFSAGMLEFPASARMRSMSFGQQGQLRHTGTMMDKQRCLVQILNENLVNYDEGTVDAKLLHPRELLYMMYQMRYYFESKVLRNVKVVGKQYDKWGSVQWIEDLSQAEMQEVELRSLSSKTLPKDFKEPTEVEVDGATISFRSLKMKDLFEIEDILNEMFKYEREQSLQDSANHGVQEVYRVARSSAKDVLETGGRISSVKFRDGEVVTFNELLEWYEYLMSSKNRVNTATQAVLQTRDKEIGNYGLGFYIDEVVERDGKMHTARRYL